MRYEYQGYYNRRSDAQSDLRCSACGRYVLPGSIYSLISANQYHNLIRHVYKHVAVCSACLPIPGSRAVIDRTLAVYNDTFSDTIEIDDYLRLTLGKIQ